MTKLAWRLLLLLLLLLLLVPLWTSGVVCDRIAESMVRDLVHEKLELALRAHQQHLSMILAHQQRDLRLFAAGAVGALDEGKIPRLNGASLSGHLPEAVGCTLLDAQGRLVAQTDVLGPSPAEIAAEVPAELSTVRVTDPTMGPSGLPVYDVYLPLLVGVGRLPAKPSVNILACRLNSIFSSVLTEHREGLALTGEVYLVSAKTRLMLTESRFIPNAIGRVKTDTTGVREALTMRTGIASYSGLSGRSGRRGLFLPQRL
ncbi:MAG: hypothetical protein EPO64_01780 [Nitrospirae bacterium]|nr:MAG: hypothetical protein EPO64_01780 [Nitrospirota bacterium]